MIHNIHKAKFIFALFFFPFIWGCEKIGDKDANQLPDTKLIFESINLSGEDRLNSIVDLSWYGTDPDGYIIGFEYSLDNTNWFFTTSQDTTFRFSLPAGSDTADIDFYIRALDNDNEADDTPAYLSIPLKNTPPIATFNEDGLPADSVLLISSFQYLYDDQDGNETVVDIQFKINNGEWFSVPVDRGNRIVSIIPNNPQGNGAVTASVQVDGENVETNINGLELNALNQVFVRAVDNAGATSVQDTSNEFYVKAKTSDLLFVSGHDNITVTGEYLGFLTATYPSLDPSRTQRNFDFVDYGRDGALYQPRFWNPTFQLLLEQYETLILATSGRQYQNPVTNQTASILEFSAGIIQEFISNPGKRYFITTRFNDNSDINAISGVLPLEELVVSGGLVRILPDSGIVSSVTNYPDLQPNTAILGPRPFIKTIDAENLYRARLTKINGWEGDNLVAALRRNGNGNVNQVFLSLQLHELDRDVSKIHDFLDQVINNDFDW